MNRQPLSLRAFRLVTDETPIRFLGLTVSERNRRVARRCGAVDDDDDAQLPTLTVPRGVAITQALIESLPDPAGVIHIFSEATALPLVWSAAGADSRDIAATRHAPEGAVLDVSTASARHQSAWRLLRASGKPKDGWLSRHVHRRISRPFSYLFLHFRLTANAATLLTFLLGVCSARLLAGTTHVTMIAGALLYWAASVADGIDGEMARLTLSESVAGEQLDTAVDQATHLCALMGAGIGWWRQGIGSHGLAMAWLVAIGLPTTLLWAMSLVRRAEQRDQFFVVTKPIEVAIVRAAEETGALPLRAAALVFVLFRRESIACTFFFVSLATGFRVVYPALVMISLVVVAATFLFYRDPINGALATVRS